MCTIHRNTRESSLNPSLTSYEPPNVIIWVKVLEQIKTVCPQFEQFLQRPSLKRFPDGSAYIAGKDEVLLLHELLAPYRLALRIRDNDHFRPLRSFGLPPTEYYQIMVTEEYFENIGGEQDFMVSPGPVVDALPGEAHPERLFVSVCFWGGLAKASRSIFFQAMMTWADSIGTQGIFGEGPAFFFPESILFDRRRATFLIDVSRSGQQTVNWLTLSILNYASGGDYVSQISYGNTEEEV